VGNVRAQKPRYTTIAYRFFREVHVKHVRTTSNMMSRQWSAAKCGDDDGRRSSAASLTYAIYETRTSGFGSVFIYLFLANCSLFHSRDDGGGGRVSAKINQKTAARPLPAVMIISRARQHAHTHDDGGGGSNRGYGDISGSSGKSSSNDVVVP
jgi:hypothetical protein